MSSEEIIRHLYENPELAKSLGIDPAVVNAAAAAGTTKKSSYRTELLQKQGVPFVQWAIVLLVVGFGLYQFFKFVKPQTASVKQKVKRKGGKKLADKVPRAEDIVLNKVVAEIEGAGDESKDGAGKGSSKKLNKKKQTKKTKIKPAQSSASKAKDDAYDSDTSEGVVAPSPSKSKQKKVTLVEEPVVIIPDEISGGWQTVGSKSAHETTGTNGVANKTTNSKPPNGSSIAAAADGDGGKSPGEKKKKKNKTKKPEDGKVAGEAIATMATVSPSEDPNDTVDGDEALALRLQAEENRLGAESSLDDVWAEVTSKKKKNKS
jgi:hypothetical protein